MENTSKFNDILVVSNEVTVVCSGDTYAGMVRADEEMALLMARGLAVRIDVSCIVETGLVRAVKRFCNTAKETAGELMMVLDIDHPDLQVVLKMSETRGRLTLKVNKHFMQALSQGTEYGTGEKAVDTKVLWGLMARSNIIFGYMSPKNYCASVSARVELSDFVVRGEESATFDFDRLSHSVAELLSNGEQRLMDGLKNISAIVESIEDRTSLEYGLFVRVRDNTQSLRMNTAYLTGIENALQLMGYVHGSAESAEFINQISHICPVKVEQCPMPRGVRTMEQKSACIKAWENGCNAFRLVSDSAGKSNQHYMAEEEHILKRPQVLDADVVRFQNKKEKWIAFIGLIDGRPYEVFTGIADDEEGIFCPKSVNSGKIIKAMDEKGQKRYDFQFINKRGFKTTIEGLSEKFNPEFWNYAKLISGVLRYGMPIEQVVKLVGSLELNNVDINNWKSGVVKALKKYLPNDDSEL